MWRAPPARGRTWRRYPKDLAPAAEAGEAGTKAGTKAGKSSIQRALATLASDGVLDRWDGEWRFADDEFRIWVSGTIDTP